MKANKSKVLFKVLTGSRLYGTNSPTSDFDYKAVVLPSLNTLLLGKRVVNFKERPEGLKAGDKMLDNEAETEYLPLQVFLDDFFGGQTYALEVTFALLSGKAEFDEKVDARFRAILLRMFEQLAEKFLTNNVKKMVGYAVSQSQLYGLKTERYTTLKQAVGYLDKYAAFYATSAKLGDPEAAQLLDSLLHLPHVKPVMMHNSAGGSELAPGIEVVGKKFHYTNTVHTVMYSLKGSLDKYGNRVASFEGEGTDWKALSHAVRVTEQVLELSRTGKLVFPRPSAEYLRDAKNGKYELDAVMSVLQDKFSQVDEAVANSVLQERTPALEEEFEEWKVNYLRALYDV